MRLFLLFVATIPCVIAQGGANCREVGGGILTNLIVDDAKNPPETLTLGSATGDFRGGVGVEVLSTSGGVIGAPTVFHNRHRWVTESGETILLADAEATAYAIPAVPGLYAVAYADRVQIKGGTGRFSGASGSIVLFGALDLNKGQIVLRYGGQVCLRPVAP